MVIPKGKKFQFIGARSFSNKENGTDKIESISEIVKVPSVGYLGNAYTSQDISFALQNQFSKPLEGILDRFSNIVDLGLRLAPATNGASIRNNRFTSVKYWVGTEPVNLDIQLTFETQIDSYFDVYKPVIELMNLALPGTTNSGFFTPPTPTLKLVATELVTFVNRSIGALRGEDDAIIGKTINSTAQMARTIAGNVKNRINNISSEGYITSLYIGNNFRFTPLLIKSMTPVFSSELAYAPIWAIGAKLSGKGNAYKKYANPEQMGEYLAKLVSQFLCASVAFGNNAVQALKETIKKLPSGMRKIIADDDGNSLIKDLPSFPIKAEVNISAELQFPFTKGLLFGKDSTAAEQFKSDPTDTKDITPSTSISYYFREEGYNDFG